MKLTKAFTAVPPGEIYPVEFQPGDECPGCYEDSAREQGCLPQRSAPKAVQNVLDQASVIKGPGSKKRQAPLKK